MGWKEKIIAQEARNPRVVSLAQTEEKKHSFLSSSGDYGDYAAFPQR